MSQLIFQKEVNDENILISLIIILSMAGLASTKGHMAMKQAEDYTVNMKMDKNPPVSGNNNMGISILDKAGAYVTDDIMT